MARQQKRTMGGTSVARPGGELSVVRSGGRFGRVAAGDSLLAEVLERVTDGIVALDLDGRYIYVNARAGEMFGRRPEDLIGKHIWTEFPEGVGHPFHLACERAMREQTPLTMEEYFEPWGRWYENHICPSPQGLTIYLQDVTDRKLTERALHESEERLALAVQASNTGIWDWDLRTNEVYFSPEWKAQLGYRDDEIGKSLNEWESRVHPDDRERVLAAIASYIADPRSSYKVELRMQHKDGSYRSVLGHGALLKDADGMPYRMLGAQRDITDRKAAQDALRESEEKFAAAFAQSPVGLVLAEFPSGVWVEANRTTQHLLGYTQEELLGHTSVELGIYDQSVREQMNRKVAEHGGMRDVEITFVNRLGAQRRVLYNSTLIQTAAGTRALTAIVDLTERWRAEERLEQAHSRLAQAQRLSRTGSFEIDIKTGVQTWSDELRRLAGMEPESEVPQAAASLAAFVHPDDRERIQKQYAAMPRARRPITTEFRGIRLDGAVRYNHLIAETARDARGTPIAIRGTVQDITERVQAEEEIRHLHAERDRLAKRLLETQEAERVSLARELHDGPLQNIAAATAYLQAVKLSTAESARPEIAGHLSDSVLQLTLAAQEVRRIVSGLRPPALDRFGLAGAVRQQVEEAAARAGWRASFRTNAAGFRLPADVETALFRIAQEAITNAERHAGSRSLYAGVLLSRGRIKVRVSDRGSGFSGADGTDGKAVGLASMRERAELAGASLKIESELGRGTAVTVELPVEGQRRSKR